MVKQLESMVERHCLRFWVTRELHDEARRELLAHNGAGLNFVDWTTALAARELQMPVFTFDRGFMRQGVPVYPSTPLTG